MTRGHNVYLDARTSFGQSREKELLENFSGSGKPPCIFLSHRSSDKAGVKAIGEYIMNAGVNIYMDIDDPGLQAAVASDNHDAITVFIERGITASSDLMACLSKDTFNSCWVPYEIGFGKRAEKYLSALSARNWREAGIAFETNAGWRGGVSYQSSARVWAE
ncbi:MAG: toll/interleukin-1 receptor domain-containing protein [Verrucomicrobiota bacterium]